MRFVKGGNGVRLQNYACLRPKANGGQLEEKDAGVIEEFLSKTKNPRLRQDFGEQAHRFTPIAF